MLPLKFADKFQLGLASACTVRCAWYHVPLPTFDKFQHHGTICAARDKAPFYFQSICWKIKMISELCMIKMYVDVIGQSVFTSSYSISLVFTILAFHKFASLRWFYRNLFWSISSLVWAPFSLAWTYSNRPFRLLPVLIGLDLVWQICPVPIFETFLFRFGICLFGIYLASQIYWLMIQNNVLILTSIKLERNHMKMRMRPTWFLERITSSGSLLLAWLFFDIQLLFKLRLFGLSLIFCISTSFLWFSHSLIQLNFHTTNRLNWINAFVSSILTGTCLLFRMMVAPSKITNWYEYWTIILIKVDSKFERKDCFWMLKHFISTT